MQSGTRAGAQDFGVEAQWIMNLQRDRSAEEALDILDAVRPYKDQIAGGGRDNPERPNFPDIFAGVFLAAKEDGYRLTSHCDVHIPNSIQHIRGCIEILGVERIDHGLTGCPTR